MIMAVARELAYEISSKSDLEGELDRRSLIFTIANKYKVVLFEEHLSYFSAYTKKTIDQFGQIYKEKTGQDLTLDTLFKNIGHAFEINRMAAERLLKEYPKGQNEDWETPKERELLRKNIEILGKESLTMEAAVYLGTKYMVMKGYLVEEDKAKDHLLQDAENQMYFQASYITHNKGERLQKGDLGYYLDFARKEIFDRRDIGNKDLDGNAGFVSTRKAIGKLIKLEAKFRANEKILSGRLVKGFNIRAE